MRVSPHDVIGVLIRKWRDQSSQPSKHTKSRQRMWTKKRAFAKNPASHAGALTSDFQPPELRERNNVCCLNHPVSGVPQPKLNRQPLSLSCLCPMVFTLFCGVPIRSCWCTWSSSFCFGSFFEYLINSCSLNIKHHKRLEQTLSPQPLFPIHMVPVPPSPLVTSVHIAKQTDGRPQLTTATHRIVLILFYY